MSDFSFCSQYRVRTAHDFQNLKNNPEIYTCRSFRVFFIRNNLTHSRLGLSVTKKVGKANLRNRIKRISREIYRTSRVKEVHYDFLIAVSSRPFAGSRKVAIDQLKLNLHSFFSMILSKRDI